MPRFHLPLTIDFGLRTQSTVLTKAQYIQNGYFKKDVTSKLQNRVGLIENNNQANTLHVIASAPYANGGSIFVGYDSSAGTISTYTGGDTGGAPTVGYTLTTSQNVYGAEIVQLWDASYFVKLNTQSSGTGDVGWQVSTSATAITDSTFVSRVGTTTGLATLDRYVFGLGATTGYLPAIYNSDVGDPTTWNASGFIEPELNNGAALGIESYKNHIVFLGTNNIQFFYDAAVAVPASPLLPRKDLVYNFGVHTNTLLGAKAWWKSSKGDILTFIGNTLDGKKFIGLFNDFHVEVISTPSIETLMEAYSSYSICGYSDYGKQFIHVCIGAAISLVYDLETKLWYIFDSSIPHIGSNPYIVNSVLNYAGYPSNLYTYAPGNELTNAYYGRQLRWDAPTNARQDTGQDGTIYALEFAIQFPRYRGEVGYESRRKFQHELQLIADTQSSTDNISVQYSDDDYQTFSTARTIDMSTTLKQLQRLGYFRERAFKLTYTGTNQVRLEALEGQIRMGTN